MANTYTLIASSTVGSGGAANIEFTSIPGTYTDLAIFLSARCSGSGANGWENGSITFNNSTSGYSGILLVGRGDLAPVSISNGTSAIDYGWYASDSGTTANTFASNFIYIPNYTSSNNKSVSSDIAQETNAARAIMGFNAGLWSNSAAITSVKLTNASPQTFVQYSTAYLYGIKNS
jgi:hypothetical protein